MKHWKYKHHEPIPLGSYNNTKRNKVLTSAQKAYIEKNVDTTNTVYCAIRLSSLQKQLLLNAHLTERESKEFTRIMQSQNAYDNNYLNMGKDVYRDNLRGCYIRAQELFVRIVSKNAHHKGVGYVK